MLFAASLATLLAFAAQPTPRFTIENGDRIVWIGSALVEREQRYGYWETALHAAFPDKQFTLRNLGWSGDTVFGEARGRFNFNDKNFCFRQIVDQTLALKPTVIFVNYGANESFEGEPGLPKFEKGLEKLLDAFKPAKARIVLFTPLPFETHPRYPHSAARNAMIGQYAALIRKVAASRGLPYADLYQTALRQYGQMEKLRKSQAIPKATAYTVNGIHLSGTGYQEMTLRFLQSLGLIGELPACATGVDLPPVFKELKKNLHPLRQAIIAKNQLFFYRWRPQNETYLFGFRKHEQGRNAKEVAEFDPLVAKAEERIESLLK